MIARPKFVNGERVVWGKLGERPGLFPRFLRWLGDPEGWTWGAVPAPIAPFPEVLMDGEPLTPDFIDLATALVVVSSRPVDAEKIYAAGDRLKELRARDDRRFGSGRPPQDFVAMIVKARADGGEAFISADSGKDNWPEMHIFVWRERVKMTIPPHLFSRWAFHYGPGEEWHFVAIPKMLRHG